MWWVAVLIPVVIVAIIIAVAPVAYGSVHFHRWHHRRVPRRPVETNGSSFVRSKRRVRCPVCLASIEGATANEVITSRNEHFLETHVTTATPSADLEQGEARSA